MKAQQLDRRGAAGPWASLLLALSVVLLHLTPQLTAWATFDRTAIASGQLWRLVTGHWTHWSGEHLVWDLLVFAVVGGALELRGGRRVFLLCAVLSALLISAGVWVLQPDMVEYRGLSGIDCALVTLVAVDLPTSYAEAYDDESWDTEIRKRMDAGLELAGDDIGTPILAFDDKYGVRQAYFGPVITRVPPTEDSIAMWDALCTMMDVQGFWELKRSRTERPEFGARP